MNVLCDITDYCKTCGCYTLIKLRAKVGNGTVMGPG